MVFDHMKHKERTVLLQPDQDVSELCFLEAERVESLGVRNEACGAVYAQHHNCYQVDEAMLVKGALLHAQMAVDYLGLECQ